MKKDINEIMIDLKKVANKEYYVADLFCYEECQTLYDFILDLQKKYNNLKCEKKSLLNTKYGIETNDKITRILDSIESKLIKTLKTIETLDPDCILTLGHYIGYKESEYINIIEEQEEKYKKSCETYQKVLDETMNEKMFLEEQVKQALLILKNEDGSIPDYKIIENAIECLETKGE